MTRHLPRHSLSILTPLLLRLGRQARFRRTISLAYHDIAPRDRASFRSQVAAVLRHFRPLTLSEFQHRVTGSVETEDNGVLFTFDDAFMSGREIAETILIEFGIKAVFFVPTGFVECRNVGEWDDYICKNLHRSGRPRSAYSAGLHPMSYGDLTSLVVQGHSIGAHTISHPRLSDVAGPSQLAQEIIGSGDRLESTLHVKVDAFAFPFGTIGSMDRNSLAAARGRYRSVFTSVRGNNPWGVSGLHLRETVDPSEPPDYVLFQAAGGLSPYYWRDRRLLAQMAREGCG